MKLPKRTAQVGPPLASTATCPSKKAEERQPSASKPRAAVITPVELCLSAGISYCAPAPHLKYLASALCRYSSQFTLQTGSTKSSLPEHLDDKASLSPWELARSFPRSLTIYSLWLYELAASSFSRGGSQVEKERNISAFHCSSMWLRTSSLSAHTQWHEQNKGLRALFATFVLRTPGI